MQLDSARLEDETATEASSVTRATLGVVIDRHLMYSVRLPLPPVRTFPLSLSLRPSAVCLCLARALVRVASGAQMIQSRAPSTRPREAAHEPLVRQSARGSFFLRLTWQEGSRGLEAATGLAPVLAPTCCATLIDICEKVYRARALGAH